MDGCGVLDEWIDRLIDRWMGGWINLLSIYKAYGDAYVNSMSNL